MRAKALTFFNAISLITYVSAGQFNPRAYEATASKIATCNAIKRTVSPSSTDYVDINPTARTTILMVHGWPADWSTWSYQIEEFKDDYRLISTHPENTRSSGTLFDMVNDLDCILKHAGVEKAICMGHDWGSQICYEAARSRPDITSAVIGVAIPYIPPGETFMAISSIVKDYPKMMYQCYFDEKMSEASEELGKDVRRMLRGTYRTLNNPPPEGFLKSKDAFLDVYAEDEISPIAFMTPEEEDYLVEQFTNQKFEHKLAVIVHITQNRYQSWKFARDQGNLTLPQPVLTDTVANWPLLAWYLGTKKYIKNWTTETVTAGHWIHLENPETFNIIVRKWLTKLREEEGRNERPIDEL
ncbi:alpha/beta-hydrolase [Amanita rubescens]|nr:alpha/beta-hydrolase [Amanita rubescens]